MLHIVTGLFNAFTFWNLGNSQIDMQSRLFSIFMTLTISPPLIQQLQPRYLQLRNLYESRERNSKIYSWFAFTVAAILFVNQWAETPLCLRHLLTRPPLSSRPEYPWSFVAGTIYWACWYWPIGFPRDTFTSASMWLFVCVFEVFYVSKLMGPRLPCQLRQLLILLPLSSRCPSANSSPAWPQMSY